MNKSFQLDIVTPTKSFTFDDVVYVECPGTEGYFGVLKNHTNSIIDLKEGIISVKTEDSNVKFTCSSEYLILFAVFQVRQLNSLI